MPDYVSGCPLPTHKRQCYLLIVPAYLNLPPPLRQDGYYIKYDRDKEVGRGRHQVLQEIDWKWSE